MAMEIDESAWPLVVVRWQGALSDAESDAFLVQMDRWLARGQVFGLLLDSRGAAGASPEQRKKLIAYMQREVDRTRKLLVQAMVIDNLVQRTLFYGVNLVFPNQFASKVFAEPERALAWLRETLAVRG